MQELTRDPEPQLDWGRVRPVLDRIVAELDERDREAILLRFFEGRDFASIGAKLQLSANTARMRVERALDKLRARLARRGVTSTSAALAAVLAHQAVAAAPAGLATTIAGTALASGGGAAAASVAWLTFMSMTKVQVGVAAALAVATGAGFVAQADANASLRGEIAAAQAASREFATLQTDNLALRKTAADVAELRGEEAALARLREEAEALKARLRAEAAARARVALAASPAQAASTVGEIFDVATVERGPSAKFRAAPAYPFELRRAGVSGDVMVEFIVTPTGDVVNPLVVRSSHRGFETAAVEAVGQWKFEPAQRAGRAVNTLMQVPIVFQLAEEDGRPGTPAPKPPAVRTWF